MHWDGHGGQETRLGLGGAWIKEVFGSQVKSLDFIFRKVGCCRRCFKPGSHVIKVAYSELLCGDLLGVGTKGGERGA